MSAVMSRNLLPLFFTGLTFLSATLLGCEPEGEGDTGYTLVGPPGTALPGEPGDTDGDTEGDDMSDAWCEPFDLCTRTIDECEIDITIDSCEGWYADEANCADMAGYLACNCDCLTEATCDGYFACGEICYADFCEA